MTEGLGLLIRVGLTLAAVLGLIWLIGKGVLRRPGARPVAGASLRVLARSPLSRTASVSVVSVGGRALVLGVTEQGVSLLSRMTLAELGVEPEAEPAPQRTPVELASLERPTGRLQGSALSPHTWLQAVSALRERTTRR